MVDIRPAGPYRQIHSVDGTSVPYFVIPFDRYGRCSGPETRDALIMSLTSHDYTDVFVFSHGWNNDFLAATRHYDDFIDGYIALEQERGSPSAAGAYRPLLVGIFWPSAILVAPNEEAPRFAGTEGQGPDEAERWQMEEVAVALGDESASRFRELAGHDELTADEARELAGLLAPLYVDAADEVAYQEEAPSPDELVELWQAGVEVDDDVSGEFGLARELGGGPQAAGAFHLDPRSVLRLLTVRMMKDRSGVVGAEGVGPLLRDILRTARTAQVHMIGHSYGCKVVLSAICSARLPRNVNSVLLLQPAVNHRCFAVDAAGDGRPGGYRVALARVDRPILSTFSAHDQPLTKFFHRALQRRSDLGEPMIAGAPPSRYAALGGYGPAGCAAGECVEVPIKDVGDRYGVGTDAPELYAVDGTKAISGHSDISNPSTWWALYDQVTSPS